MLRRRGRAARGDRRHHLRQVLVAALGLAAFSGFAAGLNYAASFVLIHLLHWTVVTKQPADGAGDGGEAGRRERRRAVEAFVDEVAHLIRSQAAGIFGNLMLAGPLVLVSVGRAGRSAGAPLVNAQRASTCCTRSRCSGRRRCYAAFTGVLLFASSLIAGWAENWFVYRLDSAIAWNPAHRSRCSANARARKAA